MRLLAARGDLPAEKIGGRWLVERRGVERRRARGSAGGRRFAPRNAWAVLSLASGKEAIGVESVVRSRLRRLLSLEGLAGLAPRLDRRAAVHRYSGHPGEIAHVLDDRRLAAAGICAAGSLGLGLVPGREADGYISASVLDRFVEEHALSPAGAGAANVVLRVVPDDVWADFFDGLSRAPDAAVALDLAEDVDPRSRAAGEELLGRLSSAP